MYDGYFAVMLGVRNRYADKHVWYLRKCKGGIEPYQLPFQVTLHNLRPVRLSFSIRWTGATYSIMITTCRVLCVAVKEGIAFAAVCACCSV